MVTLANIQNDLQTAIKARQQLEMNTLRGLKARIEKEQITFGRMLFDDEMGKILQSELKRRQEAGDVYRSGNRIELALKEDEEASILAKYLPEQASKADIAAVVEHLTQEHSWTSKDFGVAMRVLKEHFGSTATATTLSKILKDKLK